MISLASGLHSLRMAAISLLTGLLRREAPLRIAQAARPAARCGQEDHGRTPRHGYATLRRIIFGLLLIFERNRSNGIETALWLSTLWS